MKDCQNPQNCRSGRVNASFTKCDEEKLADSKHPGRSKYHNRDCNLTKQQSAISRYNSENTLYHCHCESSPKLTNLTQSKAFCCQHNLTAVHRHGRVPVTIHNQSQNRALQRTRREDFLFSNTGTPPFVIALDPALETNYCSEIGQLLPDFITRDHVPTFRKKTTSINFLNWTRLILFFAILPNILAIPVRWEVGTYGECTTSCGRGTQSRSVVCRQMPEGGAPSHGMPTSRLPDVMCPSPKPLSTRSCSLVSCAPEWTPGPWSECSRTCGRGIQRRSSFCKQRLATGALQPVPDVYCSRVRPSSKRKCAILDCPPRYAVKKWSECSAACGKGVQLREVMCVRIAAGEHTVQPISIGHCSHLTTPVVERYCKQGKCAGVTTTSRRMAPKTPKIITARRTYIQRQRLSKIRLVVGMKAFVIPKTTVIVRCPVLRYRKSLIYWKFNDIDVIPDDDVITLMPDNSLRIRSVDASNIGKYTCVAGESTADFMLNITRPGRKTTLSHNQIAEHRRRVYLSRQTDTEQPSNEIEKRRRGAVRPSVISAVGGSIAHRVPPNLVIRRSPDAITPAPIFAREEELPDFANGGEGKTDKEILADLLAIAERENQQKLDGEFEDLQEVDGDFYEMTSFDPKKFEEDDRTRIEILQPPLRDNRDISFIPVPDRVTFEEPPLIKPDRVSENNQFDRFGVLDIRKFSHPRIFTQPTEAPMQVAGDIVTYVGGDLVVAEPETVTLLCEASGFPTPYLEWLKDDLEIKSGDRYIILRSDHSLRILQPDLNDTGVYTCRATNELGSDSASTTLNVAKKPRIDSTTDSVFDLELNFIDVLIGSTVKARLGATVRISCRAEGFPEPHVIWNKDVSGLGDNARILHDNTLEIESTTKADQGMYSCEASNPAGTDYQASVLVLIEPPYLADEDVLASELRINKIHGLPQLFMTSLGKHLYKARSGTSVIFGCPVAGFPEPEITWRLNGRPLSEFSSSLHFELELNDKALLQSTFGENAKGNYSCHAKNEGGELVTYLQIKAIEYSYIPGNLTECTEKCGGNGTQQSTFVCAEEGKSPVDDWYCGDIEKPSNIEKECNRVDCPPRFDIGRWSSCSKTCGIGERSRKVSCVVLQSDNTIKEVSSSLCQNQDGGAFSHSSTINELIDDDNTIPAKREPCFFEACPQWKAGAWSSCGHKCYGRGTSIRVRRIYCLDANGTKVSRNECRQSSRPRRRDLCLTSRCEPVWIASRWSSCSHSCGEDGIQTRILSCVFRGNRRQRAGSLCTKDTRPPVTSQCNREKCNVGPKPPAPISSGLCVDKSRFCSVAQSSGLCGFYKHLCCKTCR